MLNDVLTYMLNRDKYTADERAAIRESLRQKLDDYVDKVNIINKL